MRYLITTKKTDPFRTKYYDFENHYNIAEDMKVYDLHKNLYTTNGTDWITLEVDHL